MPKYKTNISLFYNAKNKKEAYQIADNIANNIDPQDTAATENTIEALVQEPQYLKTIL